jgi:nitroimidazol reductase NimA-like FMN-containing flavoprotein (pyridoxamine 5'-phosphate oxidase superfamily)
MASDTTRIRRLPEKAVSDIETIYQILDEGFVCHVAYLEPGRPVVIPTLYARRDDTMILHGSTGSGITRAVRRGSPLSIAVTHVDGLVVARSGFNSSATYRCVVVHGYGRILQGQEHVDALDRTVEALIPGRLPELRRPTESEIRQTATIEVPLEEISAKVSSGPPDDDEEDHASDVWAGIVPLAMVAGPPVPDPTLREGINLPDYLDPYRRSL